VREESAIVRIDSTGKKLAYQRPTTLGDGSSITVDTNLIMAGTIGFDTPLYDLGTSWHFFNSATDTIEVIVDGKTFRTTLNPYRVAFTHWLVEDWDAYAAECWADSIYTIWTGWMEEPVVQVVTEKEAEQFYANWGKRGRWTHREPTLSGFIEWLRKR